MREISLNKKIRVIKLFLTASSYKEIREQEGISEGSVVSIINDFREGKIPLPPDMAEYIDELRHLVVDLKKSQTSISQLKGYIKIHDKLQEMGVDVEQVEGWLDICQEIAASYASNSQFIEIFSDLVQLSSETGMTYRELLDDYKTKMGMSQELDRKLEQAREESNKTELENRESIKKAKEELGLIQKEIENSKRNFTTEEKKLKAQFNQFLKQNRLSWDKVNTVYSLIKDKLRSEGMQPEHVDEMLKEIASVGSLAVLAGQMQSKVNKLSKQEKSLATDIKRLQKIDNDLQVSIWEKRCRSLGVADELQAKNKELAQIKAAISNYRHDILVAQVIIKLLASPDALLPRDFDKLVELIVSIRGKRHAFSYHFNRFGSRIAYEPFSSILSSFGQKYMADLEETRQRLAQYLVPILKDKFTPTFAYNMTKAVKSILDFRGNL